MPFIPTARLRKLSLIRTVCPAWFFDAPVYYAKSSVKLYPCSQERVVHVKIETDERRNKIITVLANLSVEEFEEEQAAKEAMAKSAETALPPETQPPAPQIDPLTGKPVEQPETTSVTEAEIVPEATAAVKPVSANAPVFEYRREKLWGFKDEARKCGNNRTIQSSLCFFRQRFGCGSGL